jgi:hypothetical protein
MHKDGLSEFLELLDSKGGRRVYVASAPIDLRNTGAPNDVYVLQLPDGSTAAGGRGGGFGERRIIKVYHFEFGSQGAGCRKVSEVEDDTTLDQLDLPYHATAMPILDQQGNEKLVSGVIDPRFAESYRQILAPPS